jgi:hypothetical protein
MHVASSPHDLQSLPRFQNSRALLPIFVMHDIQGEFTEHRPAESIEEQSADQAALGVADHRATRDAA